MTPERLRDLIALMNTDDVHAFWECLPRVEEALHEYAAMLEAKEPPEATGPFAGESASQKRDRDWILAMAAALGTDSGFNVPIVPEAEPFRDLFAAVRGAPVEPAEATGVYTERDVLQFLGWISGDIKELHGVEVGRLLESWQKFMGTRTAILSHCAPVEPVAPPDLFEGQKMVPYETRYFNSPGMAEALGYRVTATYKRLPPTKSGGQS